VPVTPIAFDLQENVGNSITNNSFKKYSTCCLHQADMMLQCP